MLKKKKNPISYNNNYKSDETNWIRRNKMSHSVI